MVVCIAKLKVFGTPRQALCNNKHICVQKVSKEDISSFGPSKVHATVEVTKVATVFCIFGPTKVSATAEQS